LARPIRATIDLAALRHNYGVAKAAAPRSRVLAVVKANAYGHGLERAARALKDVDGFGLIEIENAVRLRESGFGREVLLLEGFFEASELPVLAASNIATAVHSEEQLRMLEAFRGGAATALSGFGVAFLIGCGTSHGVLLQVWSVPCGVPCGSLGPQTGCQGSDVVWALPGRHIEGQSWTFMLCWIRSLRCSASAAASRIGRSSVNLTSMTRTLTT